MSRSRAVAGLLLGVLGAACAAGSRPPAGTVTMTNELTFEPGTMHLKVGETLRWRNTSDLVHTVTASAERAVNKEHVQLPTGADHFDSGPLAPGETYLHRFDVPGVYRYFCQPHEAAAMVATVVVSPG